MLQLPLLGAAQINERNRDGVSVFNNGYVLVPPEASLVHGNPFLQPGWQATSVQLVGSANPLPTTLRYDVYRQEVRVRRPQGDSVVVPLTRIKEFTLTPADRRFVCYPAATLPTEVQGACAEVLANGPHLQLLKFWNKKLVKQPADNTSYGSNSTMTVLEESVRYYLRWPADGHWTAVRPKQALAGQPTALKAQKATLNSEAELTAAVPALDPTITLGH
ncbi:MAG: hypothetical protein ACRYF0_11275 [Janthinobacterium lividum]